MVGHSNGLDDGMQPPPPRPWHDLCGTVAPSCVCYRYAIMRVFVNCLFFFTVMYAYSILVQLIVQDLSHDLIFVILINFYLKPAQRTQMYRYILGVQSITNFLFV